jgi:hypothetical protein
MALEFEHMRSQPRPAQHTQSSLQASEVQTAPRTTQNSTASTLSRLVSLPVLRLPALLLLTIILVTIAYQQIGTLEVTMGPRDHRLVSDANALEVGNTDSWIRWTTDHTRLDIPLVAAYTPLALDVVLINSYPASVPDPNVSVAMDDRTLTSFFVERNDARMRHYRILLPPQDRTGWSVPIHLHSTVHMPPEDPRPLGVMLVRASLSAASSSGFPLIPPLWQMAASLVCVLSAYVGLRGFGASRQVAWWLAAAVALLLALGFAYATLQLAPLIGHVTGLLVLLALYGVVVQLLSHRHEQTAAAWVASARIPLLMGVAAWLMPVYQLLMTADGTRAVTPYPPTMIVMGGALVVLFAGLAILADVGKLHHWQHLVLGVLAVAAVAHLGVMLEYAVGRSGPDFWILFKGSREWFRGNSLYDLKAIHENHFGHVFKVPPFYGMLFVPFVEQDGLMILDWHRRINILLVLVTIGLLFLSFRIRVVSALGVGVLLLFNMRPLADTVAFGQIDIMLLLLLTIALVSALRGRESVAGVAVALGTLFKLYPVLLLALFVVRRQWRALLGFGVAFLALNGFAVLVMGWEMHRIYLFEVVPNIGGGTAWVENQTINGFLSRAFAPGMDAAIFEHPVVTALTYSGFLLTMAIATLLAWRLPRPSVSPATVADAAAQERIGQRSMLLFGLFVIIMVLAVPAAWMHYQTITILSFFAVLVYSAREGLPRWQAALFGIAYALVSYGNQWSFYNTRITSGLTILGISYKFYGLLLLFVVIVACLVQEQMAARAHSTPQ